MNKEMCVADGMDERLADSGQRVAPKGKTFAIRHPLSAIRSLITLSALCLLLAACDEQGGPLGGDPLSPCTASGTMFQGLAAASGAALYHESVSLVVDAQILAAQDIGAGALRCDAEDYRSLVPPTFALQALAAQLPPWQREGAMPDLAPSDVGSVLLEYLRIYECSLIERQYFLPAIAASEGRGRGDYLDAKAKEEAVIREELRTARASLERTLVLLAGVDRLQPLVAETECLKRISLDLRNSLGLAAEAMSCMPRGLDARGTLFVPAESD
jgi:hypothetical protein